MKCPWTKKEIVWKDLHNTHTFATLISAAVRLYLWLISTIHTISLKVYSQRQGSIPLSVCIGLWRLWFWLSSTLSKLTFMIKKTTAMTKQIDINPPCLCENYSPLHVVRVGLSNTEPSMFPFHSLNGYKTVRINCDSSGVLFDFIFNLFKFKLKILI